MQNSKAEIENEQKEWSLKKEKEDQLIQIETTFFDTINPLQKKRIQTPEKLIHLIPIIFAGLSILQCFREFGMLRFMFTSSSAEWGFSMILHCMPLLIIPLTTILFWK